MISPDDFDLRPLAEAYYKLLTGVDWTDPVMVGGLREGLNKFLSNAHLSLMSGSNKYWKTHFISEAALEQIHAGNYQELIWEHVVPKQQYIQAPCEEAAREGKLTIQFVEHLLESYWRTATITRAEDLRLARRMPDEWDGVDLLARYSSAGLILTPNPFFLGIGKRKAASATQSQRPSVPDQDQVIG